MDSASGTDGLANDTATPETRMTITKDGKVGIGTTSPGTKLDVNGDISLNNIIRFKNEYGIIEAQDKHHAIYMRNSYANISSGSPESKVDTMDFYEYGDIRFFTGGSISPDPNINNYSMGVSGERMRIKNNGRIGIGTSDPVEILDISGVLCLRGGNVSFDGTDGISNIGVGSNDIDNTDHYTNTYIRFDQAGTSNDWAYLRQINPPQAGGKIHLALDFHDDGDDDTNFSIRSVGSAVTAGSTYTPDTKFTVQGNKVGIGKPDPYSLLDIQRVESAENKTAVVRIYVGDDNSKSYKFQNTALAIIQREYQESPYILTILL